MKRILIANRGEIAKRIAGTVQDLGKYAIGVYSQNEVFAGKIPYHARFMNESYKLDGESLAETYLNIDQLISIACKANCDAIHPGFGFLSENPLFVRAVRDAGLVFIGPSAESMQIMGAKREAKDHALKVGVPVIPGYNGPEQDLETLISQAKKVGYPLLLKASAGGGGKGMRVVEKEENLISAIKSCQRESLQAFGDDRLLIEKYLINPRHIEVQIFADSKGNVVHLYERECSIQRRHQKIIEEAPSVGIDNKMRSKITESAVLLAKSLNYVGAGTIEFMALENGEYYFLEMNTRLQVEHPVTEFITGFNLVALQIQVASGEPLGFSQEEVQIKGHAIEVRLYAEDAENGFLPGHGQIQTLELPHAPGVRWDGGLDKGDQISLHYDPMFGKLICFDQNRELTRNKMIRILREMELTGTVSNRHFLMRVLNNPAFIKGTTYTSFIDDHKNQLELGELEKNEIAAVFIASQKLKTNNSGRQTSNSKNDLNQSVWAKNEGFRNL